MARRRAQWAARQRLVDPARLVFIDETWTRPTWLRSGAGRRARRAPARQGAARPLEDDDVPRRLAARPGRGAIAPRRADQRRDVPPLRRQGPRPDPAARRHRRHRTILGSHKSKAVRRAIRRPRPACFPAQILARPEPHRAALLKAQALAPTGRRPNRRCRLQRPRPDPRDRRPLHECSITSLTPGTDKKPSKFIPLSEAFLEGSGPSISEMPEADRDFLLRRGHVIPRERQAGTF